MSAVESEAASNPDLFSDVSVLRRKWQAALKPGKNLPFFEDVMLGSLGRLADHVMLIRKGAVSFEGSRAGRYVEQWLQTDVQETALEDFSPDCALVLNEAVENALRINSPHLATAHCVRDGLVQIYDVLALPFASRWGGNLTSVYVNQRGVQFNLLDAIFCATGDGILSLATIRNADGRPVDFQIVHLNQGTARLLKMPPDELRWRRLRTGSHAYVRPRFLNGSAPSSMKGQVANSR